MPSFLDQNNIFSLIQWLEFESKRSLQADQARKRGATSSATATMPTLAEVEADPTLSALADFVSKAFPPAMLLAQYQQGLKPGQQGTQVPGGPTQVAGEQPGTTTGALVSATSNVPSPWNARFNYVSGYDYGVPMSFGYKSGWHEGVDYGTPAGTPIKTPFAGTIHVQTGQYGYGNLVTVTLDNGWQLRFGHVAQGYRDGQRVDAGTVVAMSGANIGTWTKGAVTLVEWRDPTGKPHNPHSILDPVFAGTTLANLQSTGVLGTPPSMTEPAGYRTPEGVYIPPNTPEAQAYYFADSAWTSLYGEHAPYWTVAAFMSAGIKNAQQLKAVMYGMPSDIAGLSMGQRQDLRALVDQYSQQYFGRQVPDSLLQQFAAKGMTTPMQIQAWFLSHPASDLPKDAYGQIYDQLATHTQRTWGTQPTPDEVAAAAAASTPADTGPDVMPVDRPVGKGHQPL